MTIDKEQLILLLVDKTGLERDQVKDQLQELVSRIQRAAEEGKSFEVEGFGTFRMQEGNLQFVPTDTLETEINNKYAGMKPIELIGAFKEPDGEEIPDMDQQRKDDQDKVWAFDSDAAAQDEPVEEPVAEKSGEEANQPEEAEQEDTEEDKPDEELEESFEVDDEQDVEPKEPEEPQKPETEPEGRELEKVPAAEEERDPIGRFLVAAIIVITLGIGGWFIYDIALKSSNQQTSQLSNTQQSSKVPAQPTGDMQEEPPTSKQSSDQDQQRDQANSEPEQELEVTKQGGSDARQPTYGLRGTLDEKANDGYTIVVHSLRVKTKAEQRKQQLQQAGFRALVNQVTVNGTTYYRVGIGQFKSVEAAQQATPNIPEEFRDDNFIKRIK